MTLEHRITRLEGSLGGQGAIREPVPDIDELIVKLGLDPVVIRATAQANEQPIGEIIASELGMSFGDFLKDVRQRARGE